MRRCYVKCAESNNVLKITLIGYIRLYNARIKHLTVTQGAQMKSLLFLAIILILLLTVTTIMLLHKYKKLRSKIQQFNDAETWHRLAYTDDLTGLFNRTAYSKRVSEIERMKKTDGYGIILFDIDNFKNINDSKGHLEGDLVLKYVANTLKSVFSLSCFDVYRIGGDEFAVIASDITEDEIIYYLLSLKSVLEENSDIRLSKGYSVIQSNVKSAFINADQMLYADKNSRK